MGTHSAEMKLKINCPVCDASLFGISFFDDYYQEEHMTVCKKCGFKESFEMTMNRTSNDAQVLHKVNYTP